MFSRDLQVESLSEDSDLHFCLDLLTAGVASGLGGQVHLFLRWSARARQYFTPHSFEL
jgi:hypothetical protein